MPALRFGELANIANSRCHRTMTLYSGTKAALDKWKNKRRTKNSSHLAVFTAVFVTQGLGFTSNQIKSFLLVYEAVYYKRPGGVAGVYGKGHLGASFYVGRCVLREWVVRGGGLNGYFVEQGLLVGVQECLERFHRGCADYLSRLFVPNGTARILKANWRGCVQYRCW